MVIENIARFEVLHDGKSSANDSCIYQPKVKKIVAGNISLPATEMQACKVTNSQLSSNNISLTQPNSKGQTGTVL